VASTRCSSDVESPKAPADAVKLITFYAEINYYEEDFEDARKSNRNDSPWVGTTWNDHLYSMKLWHS
jgi:hypothetical protein